MPLKPKYNSNDFKIHGRYQLEWHNLGRTVRDRGTVIEIKNKMIIFKIDTLDAVGVIPFKLIVSLKTI